MIANQIYLLYFKKEERLFAQIDRILEKNGLYNVDHDGGWFILSYWWGSNMYEVVESNYKLVLRLGTPFSGQDIQLHWGDVIILDAVSVNYSWFYFPHLLIGQKEKWIINARGYTRLGNVFSLVRAGILRQKDPPDNNGYSPFENKLIWKHWKL